MARFGTYFLFSKKNLFFYFEAGFEVPANINLLRLKNITRDYRIILEFIQTDFHEFHMFSVDQQFLIHRVIILICSIWLDDKDFFWILFKQHYELTCWGVRFLEAESGIRIESYGAE